LVKTQKNPKDNSNSKDMLFWLSSKIYLHFVFSQKRTRQQNAIKTKTKCCITWISPTRI